MSERMPEELAVLVLSGEIEGLLSRCSPVVYRNPALPQIQGRGVVCDPAPDDAEFMDDLVPWIGTLTGRAHLQEALDQLAPGAGAVAGFGYRMDVAFVLALDLTSTTGRHHFDLWLERALYGGRFCDSEDQRFQAVIRDDEYEYDSGGGRIGIREYGYACWWIGDMSFAAPECGPESITAEIPGLTGIDIRSTKLLVDGSRWADAAARVAIGMHIAGMADFTGWRSLVPEWDGGDVEELVP